MFRSLAERYDDATLELRRTLPSDLRSQGCGMSEIYESVNRINADETETESETEMEDEIEQLKSERDEFAMKLSELEEELSLKDDQIDELNDRLQRLQLECDKSTKSIEVLQEVIEKQREMIEEGAEEKRQMERELCISLEHYRNAYQMLRKGLLEQKKPD
ncbi:hypothetical protein L1987_22137 [Smallanthus sonchifolius]|uniref:Uncharacterized protein n=1 Tax=Smallanthus sonchifolius TaxID=185202 RepID=A0ACB9IFD2_9ASTR|nr:hypothetical protein L1987_22137 [Smallanthus sonchifolius]